MQWNKGRYNVKGSALKNLKTFFNNEQPGGKGFDFWTTGSENEKVEAIQSSVWYDVALYYKSIEAVSAELKIDIHPQIERIAGFALENDLNGIYRMIMKLEGPVKVLAASIQNVKNYFDFVTISIHKNEVGVLTFTSSMPEEFVDYHIPADKGAMTGILKVCGYKVDDYNILLVMKKGEKSFYTVELKYSKT